MEENEDRTVKIGDYKFELTKIPFSDAQRIWTSLQTMIGRVFQEGDDMSNQAALMGKVLSQFGSKQAEVIYQTASKHTLVHGDDYHGQVLNKCESKIFSDTNVSLHSSYMIFVCAYFLKHFLASGGVEALSDILRQVSGSIESPKE